MDDENNVSTTGQDKQKRDEKSQANRKDVVGNAKKAKEGVNIIKFIAANAGIIVPILIALLVIIGVLGTIAFLYYMPGLWVERVKEFGRNLWGDIEGFVTGDDITPKVSKEEQIELAQRIQDMGYDIVGYGFADVKYEYDDGISDKDGQKILAEDIEGYTNGKIVGFNSAIDGRNYLQAYIAQSEAIYVPSIWSVMGFFNSVGSNINNLFEDLSNIFTNSERTDTAYKDAKAYSAGMINIRTGKVDQIIERMTGRSIRDLISIDRENKILKMEFPRGLFGLVKDVYYFGMEDWSSRYGKPLELFLSLHLGTMMPDLSYDLATSDAFNTKVNIDLQKAKATFKVIFDKDGTEDTRVTHEDIEKTYLQIMFGMSDDEINRFADAGVLDDAFEMIINNKRGHNDELYGLYDGKRLYPEEPHSQITGTDLSEVEQSLLGHKYSEFNVIYVTKQKQVVTVGSTGSSTSPGSSTPTGTTTTIEVEVETPGKEGKRLAFADSSSEAVQSSLDNSVLSGITGAQLEEFAKLILEGRKATETFLPRITTVDNHWYYSYVNFVYGQAKRAKKKMDYEPQDEESVLAQKNLNGGKVILDQTFEDASGSGGIYYQLCEPEVNGPNDAIVALFKGGEGRFNGEEYDFPGEYYRYDGTRNTALRIANAKAIEEGKITYKFQNEQYATASMDNKEWKIEKSPVTFATEDEEGNKSYTDAFTAFSILEGTHTLEAEYVYRNLKDLLVKLHYFSKENFMKPLTQIFLWPIESVGSDNIAQEDNSEILKGIVKDENEYGLFLKNGEAFTTGGNIIAPGDAIVQSVEGNTIRIKFKSLSSATIEELNAKFGSDYHEADANIVLDMEMTISGINVNVSAGDTISRGQVIGTATNEDIRIILSNIDKSIVDEIEKYMYPIYKPTIEDDFMNGKPNSGQNGATGEDYEGTFDPDYVIVDIGEAEKYIYNELRQAGCTKAGACGILGNLVHENAAFNPTVTNEIGAYGLVQWLGGRQTNLKNWCASNNKDYASIEGQVAFMIYEMQTSYKSVWNTVTTSNDVLECSDIVCKKYEVPGNYGKEIPDRRTDANAYMKQMAD